LAANLTTAFLVSTASQLGLPMSTTHVSGGAIIGVGVRWGVGAVRWHTIGEIGLAWLVTWPMAALLVLR
jgi:PiT family inorganic phosphate transporter